LRTERGTHLDPELLHEFEETAVGQTPEVQSPLA
jgi:hypothetical protein